MMAAMGLAADLGYSQAPANSFHRLIRRFAGTRVGGVVLSHTLRHVDDAVGRLSGGRQSAPGLGRMGSTRHIRTFVLEPA